MNGLVVVVMSKLTNLEGVMFLLLLIFKCLENLVEFLSSDLFIWVLVFQKEEFLLWFVAWSIEDFLLKSISIIVSLFINEFFTRWVLNYLNTLFIHVRMSWVHVLLHSMVRKIKSWVAQRSDFKLWSDLHFCFVLNYNL